MKYDYNELITNYVIKKRTQYAVMLNSWWGSGKTYYIKNQLSKHLQERNIALKHISLFNISSLQQITKQLFFGNNKGKKKIDLIKSIGGLVIQGLSQTKLNINLDDLPLLKAINFNDQLIVLDDLERSNLDIIAILGYVSDLVENYNAKVLLVCNEEEIINKSIYNKLSEAVQFVDDHKDVFFSNEENSKDHEELLYSLMKPSDLINRYVNKYKSVMYSYSEYSLYKEKIINQTIKFTFDLIDLYENLTNEYFIDEKAKKIMNDSFYKGVIIDQFNQNEKINLRTVIFSFEILYKMLAYFEEEKYEPLDYRNLLVETYLRETIDIVSWYKSKDFMNEHSKTNNRNLAIWQYIQESDNQTYKLLIDAVETGNFTDGIYKNIEIEYKELLSVVAVDLYKFNQFNYNEGDIQRKREIAKNIYQKLEKNQISINMYLEIFRRFYDFEKTIGDKENFKQLHKIMIKNLENPSQVYRKFRSFAVYNRGEPSQEYRDCENDLIEKLEDSNIKFIGTVINNSLLKDNWVNTIRKFSESNTISFSSLNKFLSFFDFNLLWKKIVDSNGATITDFRRYIREIYSFSNIIDYFSGDKEIIEKIIKQIDLMMPNLKEDIKLHLIYLRNDLKEILPKLT